MDLSTQQVTTHTLTLTDAELVELREAATCALDLGGANDEHAPTWRKLARLGMPPTRNGAVKLSDPTLGQL